MPSASRWTLKLISNSGLNGSSSSDSSVLSGSSVVESSCFQQPIENPSLARCNRKLRDDVVGERLSAIRIMPTQVRRIGAKEHLALPQSLR